MSEVIDVVAKATKTLMFKEPYYGLFLIGLNKIYSDKLPTAGVSKNSGARDTAPLIADAKRPERSATPAPSMTTST